MANLQDWEVDEYVREKVAGGVAQGTFKLEEEKKRIQGELKAQQDAANAQIQEHENAALAFDRMLSQNVVGFALNQIAPAYSTEKAEVFIRDMGFGGGPDKAFQEKKSVVPFVLLAVAGAWFLFKRRK